MRGPRAGGKPAAPGSPDTGRRRTGRFPVGAAAFLAVALLLPGCARGGPSAYGGGGGGAAVSTSPPSSIPGFALASLEAQRVREETFLGVPSADSARAHVRRLTRGVHLAGTPATAELARTLAARLEGLGFEVETRRYDVWLPHPELSRVALVRPERRELATVEPYPVRPTGGEPISDTPLLAAWHAYAADGVVEAPVVYAHRGLPEDYRHLEDAGVEVRGRIVLARYGGAYRGVKVAEAEARGAAGILLFPDPADDGYAAGDTVPVGPYRPSGSVQRGTVQYMWRHTGDPLTPGAPSLPESADRPSLAEPGAPEGTVRLDPDASATLPRIPALPLSYSEARHVLEALRGPEAPEAWQGALPVPYRLGGAVAVARMESRQDTRLRPIFDVIARIPGETSAEVVVGNHFDAWLLGGTDPHSGTAALLELARGLGALRAEGWRPRRTVTLAFWDAEEFGVVGSTEWVEDEAARLREHAVAYLNVDVLLAGILDVAGSPSLRDLVVSAAESVADPVTGRSMAALWRERQGRTDGEPPTLGVLGAGSDWTAFFHWAGVPSLQWTSNGRGTYWPVYHSVLDDFEYAERFADPGFEGAAAMARVMGLTALRLADADALPFRYSRYAEAVGRHVDALLDTLPPRKAAELEAALEPVRDALRGMAAAAAGLEARADSLLAAGRVEEARRLTEGLPRLEGLLLDEEGMPGRPWYRHTLWAPAPETGYASVPFPGVVEALGREADLARQVERVRAALERVTEAVKSASNR